jgi:putative ABC transport system permease protein
MESRRREFAVRLALGAGRGRLIRQLLAEGVLLAAAGAVPGVALAAGAVHWFQAAHPVQLPPGDVARLDARVLAYTLGVVVLTAVLFSVMPAFQAVRISVNEALKSSVRGTYRGMAGQRISRIIVAVEITFSLVLLSGAGLLLASVQRFSAVPLGFEPAGLWTLGLSLPGWRYGEPEQRIQAFEEILRNAAALLGEGSAALVNELPLLGGRFGANHLVVRGQRLAGDAPRDTARIVISPSYFRVMHVPVRMGRVFDSRDRASGEPVAIVNEALARKYFPGKSPIGEHIRFGGTDGKEEWWKIVGVAADEKEADFFNEMSWNSIPYVFRPFTQEPTKSMTVLARNVREGRALFTLRSRIQALDPAIPVTDPERMERRLSHLFAYPRFRAALLTGFAFIALVLATVGLYGVLAHQVHRRRQEIGIRMALGARPRDVISLVLGQSMRLVACGFAAGLGLTVLLTRFLGALLYGVSPSDPGLLLAVVVLLGGVALLATYLPARRAAEVDPASTLRNE